jgi:hypothetical protein
VVAAICSHRLTARHAAQRRVGATAGRRALHGPSVERVEAEGSALLTPGTLQGLAPTASSLSQSSGTIATGGTTRGGTKASELEAHGRQTHPAHARSPPGQIEIRGSSDLAGAPRKLQFRQVSERLAGKPGRFHEVHRRLDDIPRSRSRRCEGDHRLAPACGPDRSVGHGIDKVPLVEGPEPAKRLGESNRQCLRDKDFMGSGSASHIRHRDRRSTLRPAAPPEAPNSGWPSRVSESVAIAFELIPCARTRAAAKHRFESYPPIRTVGHPITTTPP